MLIIIACIRGCWVIKVRQGVGGGGVPSRGEGWRTIIGNYINNNNNNNLTLLSEQSKSASFHAMLHGLKIMNKN